MKAEKLEELMYRFQEKEFDVLIATTIIENGIDIVSVNTIIIDDAHTFGLSQLYQLRGRVGRSSTQSFASRDLEIRGSGNILGSQQSGHINAVGYEMYIRLLEEEIKKIRTQEKELKRQEENLKYQGVASAT